MINLIIIEEEVLTSTLMKTLCSCMNCQLWSIYSLKGRRSTFSSAMVNFPCVSLLFSANDCRFFIASFCSTEIPNLTFALVYSCPGCLVSIKYSALELKAYIDFGIIRNSRKGLIQSCMHLRSCSFKKPSAS